LLRLPHLNQEQVEFVREYASEWSGAADQLLGIGNDPSIHQEDWD
jgi:hypothetical protein